MSMLRSMDCGITGLRNHQVRMDVIGNNIANTSTVGNLRPAMAASKPK